MLTEPHRGRRRSRYGRPHREPGRPFHRSYPAMTSQSVLVLTGVVGEVVHFIFKVGQNVAAVCATVRRGK